MSSERPKPQHDLPPVSVTTTWDEYFAMHFAADDEGRLYCVLCGCYVRDGWQVDHVDRVHNHFGGF